MIYLKAIFLAIVEGATEFIPVSSTGHMILVDEFMHLSADKTFNDAFMIIIQLPAIAAVVVYFWKTLWPFGQAAEQRNTTLLLWTKIGAAFLPAAFFGFLLDKLIEKYLFNGVVVASALLLGGIALILIERTSWAGKLPSVHAIPYKTAVGIGLFQCLAMIPGTSRSAATILGAMVLGAGRAAAAEFSFFLAIPTMLGATTLKMLKTGAHYTLEEWLVLALGSAVSFLVAYAVVAVFVNYIRRHDFKIFGYYRIALGLAVLCYFFLHRP